MEGTFIIGLSLVDPYTNRQMIERKVMEVIPYLAKQNEWDRLPDDEESRHEKSRHYAVQILDEYKKLWVIMPQYLELASHTLWQPNRMKKENNDTSSYWNQCWLGLP